MSEEARVTIAIPTVSFGRFSLLFEMIESIQAGEYKNVHIVVVVDGNPKIYEKVKKRIRKRHLHDVSVILNEERIDWVASINRVLREFDSEYYIYASDDLIFPLDCIKNAMKTMRKCFPDGFGVISLSKRTKCIFGLLGRKFADHFPNRQVFCPDFIHYGADSELFRIVKKLGKYAYPPERESQVEHFRLKDETRQFARKARNRDGRLKYKRQEKGYRWGIDFNLITERK